MNPSQQNPPTPRVTARYLSNFQNRIVLIVGRVSSVHGASATVDAGGGSVTCALQVDSNFIPGNVVEIVGKVGNDANLTVKVLASTDFGRDFDLAAADAVVEATHKYRDIFYSRD